MVASLIIAEERACQTKPLTRDAERLPPAKFTGKGDPRAHPPRGCSERRQSFRTQSGQRRFRANPGSWSPRSLSRRASPHSVPSPRQRFVGGSESAGKSRTHLGRRAVDPLRRDAGAAAAAAATATAPAAGARPALGGPWRARGSGRRAPRPPRRRRASARQVLSAAPELPLPSPPPPPLPPAPAPRLHFKQVR